MSPRDVHDEEDEQAKMPLLEHLLELRNRLLYASVAVMIAFAGCYYFSEQIFGFLVRPLAHAFEGQTGRRLIYTGLAETFFTYIKVAFFAGTFLSFPIIANQLWKFVAPGLYRNERKAFLPFLVATPVLFFMGGAFVYYFIMPLAWQFFVGFESAGSDTTLPIQLEARVSEYLSLVMKLIFAFGLFFEMPVVLTLLARAGLITSAMLVAKRRIAIVVIFIFAAVLTPPDLISQIGLAVPGMLLYEISVILVRMMEKKRAQVAAEEDEEDEGV